MSNRKALRDPVPTPATRFQERFENERLKAANQLPDLEGDALAYAWYYEDRDRDGLTVIEIGDRVVWSEPTLWEGWPRFNQVKTILKDRYDSRFCSFTSTSSSELYLYGDDLFAPHKVFHD